MFMLILFEMTCWYVAKQFYGQSRVYSDVLDYLNMIFTGVFTIEFILKLFAFRIKVSTSDFDGMSTLHEAAGSRSAHCPLKLDPNSVGRNWNTVTCYRRAGTIFQHDALILTPPLEIVLIVKRRMQFLDLSFNF